MVVGFALGFCIVKYISTILLKLAALLRPKVDWPHKFLTTYVPPGTVEHSENFTRVRVGARV